MKADKFNTLLLDGGALVFDFVNTVNTRNHSAPIDFLANFDDLIKWCRKTKTLPPGTIKALNREKLLHPRLAQKTFLQLKSTRETLYRFFLTLANNSIPEKKEVDSFNFWLTIAFKDLKVAFKNETANTVISNERDPLSEPFRCIMKSAYDLVTTESFTKIKKCPACGWIFLDKTKNGKRRWCNMRICGSNDKALRYYYRSKTSSNDKKGT